jgi:nicotinamide mononucleotide adenylyltransferase
MGLGRCLPTYVGHIDVCLQRLCQQAGEVVVYYATWQTAESTLHGWGGDETVAVIGKINENNSM